MRAPICAMVVSIVLVAGCSDETSTGPSGAGVGGAATGGVQATGGASPSAGMATGGGAPSAGATTTGGAPSAGATTTGGAPNTGGTPGATGGSASDVTGGKGNAGAPGGGTSGGTSAGGADAGGMPSGGAGGSVAAQGCSRETLQAAADALANALEAGDSTKMSLSAGATYAENMQASTFTDGVWKAAIQVAFRRDLLDVETCESFSEIIVTEGHQYVIGASLKLEDGKVSKVDALVTDEGDWLFDADAYAKYSKAEDWSLIPAADQDTREVLIAAANAYFDLFNDETTVVPWGDPCNRLEGGQAYTMGTCDVGVPTGITFADKHFIVDRDLGTAVGIVRFGGSGGLPDSHMFRCLDGKIRYVHTITVCDEPNCGL